MNKNAKMFTIYPKTKKWYQSKIIITCAVIATMAFCGCQEEEFYIDESCNLSEVVMIKECIKLFNYQTGDNFKISGLTDFDININTIICNHESDDHWYLGEYSFKTSNIVMYSKKINNKEKWISVFLHEFGHLHGAEHSDNKNDVMYKNPTSTTYTDRDLANMGYLDVR